MVFKAKYIKKDGKDLWRTIHADALPEAIKIAERYTPKNYILSTVTQKEGGAA